MGATPILREGGDTVGQLRQPPFPLRGCYYAFSSEGTMPLPVTHTQRRTRISLLTFKVGANKSTGGKNTLPVGPLCVVNLLPIVACFPKPKVTAASGFYYCSYIV